MLKRERTSSSMAVSGTMPFKLLYLPDGGRVMCSKI